MAGNLPIEFIDRAGATPGTNLARQYLGTLQVMQSCLKAGTLPTSSASLSVTFPVLTLVVSPGAGAQAVEVITTGQSVSVSGGASTDNYIYVDESGTFSQLSVSHGSSAPATPSNTIALCYATTNAGNTAVTSVTQIAPQFGVSAEQVAAPVNQTPSAFTWSITSTIGDQIRGLLNSIANVVFKDSGGHILTSGTAPTAAAGGNFGTITVASGSTDQHGSLSGTTSGSGSNTFCTLTFHSAMPNATYTVIAHALPTSGALGTPMLITSKSTGSVVLNFPASGYTIAAGAYGVDYIIMC